MSLDRRKTSSNLSDAAAEKLSKAINGRSGRFGKTTIGMKRSLLQDGKGAEVPAIHERYLMPLYKSIKNDKGPELVNAEYRQREIWQGKNVDMDFAFKMALDVSEMYRNQGYNSGLTATRFTCANVFRHYDASSFNPKVTGGYQGAATAKWNNYLGPDASLVRQGVPQGTAIQPLATGLDKNLLSPYRYPKNASFMYSRFNMQLLENTGWNLNPMKYKYDTQPATDPPVIGGPDIETPDTVKVWPNAPIVSYEVISQGGAATNTWPTSSYPSQQSQQVSGTPQFDTNNKIKERYVKDGYYRSQFNTGHVSYNFVNESTNGAVVDVVIIGIKKGHELPGGEALQSRFFDQVGQGYLNSSLSSVGAGVLDGKRLLQQGAWQDARNEFLPSNCFKNGPSIKTDISSTYQHTRPFKVLGRDQFVVGGGQNRSYNLQLPRMNYDARDYMHTAEPYQLGAEEQWATRDHTIMVLIGCCSTFTAKLEVNPSNVPDSAIIDHNAGNVLMSVTGTYSEQPHPVYYCPAARSSWIQGVLERPTYKIPAGTNLPIVEAVDLANLDQQAPGGGTSTTVQGSISYVGPANADPDGAGA